MSSSPDPAYRRGTYHDSGTAYLVDTARVLTGGSISRGLLHLAGLILCTNILQCLNGTGECSLGWTLSGRGGAHGCRECPDDDESVGWDSVRHRQGCDDSGQPVYVASTTLQVLSGS
jgi:hypothetical protein